MKKGERNIPNFSKKPNVSRPVAQDRPVSPAPAIVRAPRPKPPATSAKSGRRGQ